MSDWRMVHTDRLDGGLLSSLFDNEIAAVRVPSFFDAGTVDAALESIHARGLDFYDDVDPPIGRIGITQFEHRHDEWTMKEYFDRSLEANRDRAAMFAESGDLLAIALDRIGDESGMPVRIATEPDGREYFAGLVRVIDEALLHCDWAPHDATDWAIGEIDAQITWNVFCSVPESGGATVVYNRPWDEHAERQLVEGSYGYRPDIVAGVESVRIEPRRSDLVLFNSRNFHQVEAGQDGPERISLSSFVGRAGGGHLVAWS